MTFEKAVFFTIEREGGYVNDPHDPGGETKYGISKRSYPDLDIPNLKREDAEAIYRKEYWDKCKCSDLPHGIDLLTFDAAVNQGPEAAIKMLQRALKVKDVLTLKQLDKKSLVKLRGAVKLMQECWEEVR